MDSIIRNKTYPEIFSIIPFFWTVSKHVSIFLVPGGTSSTFFVFGRKSDIIVSKGQFVAFTVLAFFYFKASNKNVKLPTVLEVLRVTRFFSILSTKNKQGPKIPQSSWAVV